MASIICRTGLFLRPKACHNVQTLLKKKVENAVGANLTFAAHLTSYHGGKAERKKPWPYKTKGFRYWHLPFDRVDSRLDDNSKVIVIDGNLATGKTELGQKIAKEFDLLYVPDVPDEQIYLKGKMNIDTREFDPQLPIKAKSCDFQTFYSQRGPPKLMTNFARTQYLLFRHKVLNYAQNVINHVLNTGQGVVMNRGMWSDLVFAYALRKHGHMSPAALKAYQFQYDMLTTQEMWHPHLIIYLDAPISLIRDHLKKRNTPWEVNSPVLTDEFLQSISDEYKKRYLPSMKDYCEILTYDLGETPELDFEMVVEDLESLNLDTPTREAEKLFSDWIGVHNRDYNELRSLYSKHYERKMWQKFNFRKPYEAEELILDGDDYLAYYNTVELDPRIAYEPKYQPDDGMRLLRVL